MERLFGERQRGFPAADARTLFNETIRGMIDYLITDIIDHTTLRLEESGISSVEDVRRHQDRLVAQSERASAELDEIADLLFRDLYRSESVAAQMEEATSS